jgi:hypothetical protein
MVFLFTKGFGMQLQATQGSETTIKWQPMVVEINKELVQLNQIYGPTLYASFCSFGCI